MAKSYSYNLRLEREDITAIEAWAEAGLSRSAILRLAIDDIPLQQVIERLAGMKLPRPGEYGMPKIPFSIHSDQRAKLDALAEANVEAAFVVRHSLKCYFEKSIEELKHIRGTMRARGKQRAILERERMKEKLGGEHIDPLGAAARGRGEPVTGAPIPIRTPGIDWSRVGQVKPKGGTSPEAAQVARETAARLPPPVAPPGPRDSQAEVSAALEGISFEEAKAGASSGPSPLEALRKMKGEP